MFMCAIILLLAWLVPGSAWARVWLVGPARDLATPSAAALVVKDGDVVRIDAGTYSDCAVWRANRLTIQGEGDVVLRDRVCDGKAIFVTQGDGITVRGIAFVHARAPSRNGAGIRGEGAD